MTIIRFADIAPGSWGPGKGNGPVYELVRGTDAAGTAGWRISITGIQKPGAFSAFEGMDRIITVIDGEVLELTVGGTAHLMEKYRPFRFAGDVPASAALPTGPVMVLNVMTIRERLAASVMVVELSRKQSPYLGDGQSAVLLHGTAEVRTGGTGPTALAVGDAVLGSADLPQLLGRGFAAVVSVYEP